MEEMGTKVLAVVMKHAKPMLIELIAEIAKPAIMQAVAQSENKFDDALVPMLLPALEKALMDQIEKIQA